VTSGHGQVGHAPNFSGARYAGHGRFLLAVDAGPDAVGHFLWPGGVPHGVQLAAHGHEVLLSGMSMDALQAMRTEYGQWLANHMMAVDETAVAELAQHTPAHGAAAPGHVDVHPDQKAAEWAQHLVTSLCSGTHQVADVVELASLVAETAGAEVAFLAAADALLGPIGAVALVVEIVFEVVEAFGTGRELCKKEGFCYGVLWQVLGDGNHDKQFLDWPPDTAEQRRESFLEGVAEGRAKANDARVRGTIQVELARYLLHGSSREFAAIYVINEMWARVRENEIANKDLPYPAPSNDEPIMR
jgi:hypothetical protein